MSEEGNLIRDLAAMQFALRMAADRLDQYRFSLLHHGLAGEVRERLRALAIAELAFFPSPSGPRDPNDKSPDRAEVNSLVDQA